MVKKEFANSQENILCAYQKFCVRLLRGFLVRYNGVLWAHNLLRVWDNCSYSTGPSKSILKGTTPNVAPVPVPTEVPFRGTPAAHIVLALCAYRRHAGCDNACAFYPQHAPADCVPGGG